MVFFQLLLLQTVISDQELCSENAKSLTEFSKDKIKVEYFAGVHKHIEVEYTRSCESLNLLLELYGEDLLNCETEIDPRSMFFEYSPVSLVEVIIEKISENTLVFLIKPYIDSKGEFEVSLTMRIIETEALLTGKHCTESSCATECKDTALTTAATHTSYNLKVQMVPSYNESAISLLWLFIILALLLMFILIAIIVYVGKKNQKTKKPQQNRRILYAAATQDLPMSPAHPHDRVVSSLSESPDQILSTPN